MKLLKLGAICAASIAVLANEACAADMPVPSASTAAATTQGLYTSSGLYFGIDTIGGMGQLSTSGVPGAAQVQAEVGGLIGYSGPVGKSSFWFVEGLFNWANINGQSNGLALTGPLSFQQRFGVGTPMASFLSLIGLSNISLPTMPTLPSGVTAVSSHPYLFVAVHEQDVSANIPGLDSNRQWELAPGFGPGLIIQLSDGAALDLWGEAQLGEKSICIPANAYCASLSTTYRAGMSFKFSGF
jgi:opacity protein-like surface antigen